MANTISAYTPQIWSRKAVAILREKIVMPNMVRVDFSADLAQAGDTVNTRKVTKMSSGDVDTTTGVSVSDVAATNIQVTLNQHKHVTFRISDREQTRSFQNLVNEFLDPAMLALANTVDLSLLGLYSDFTTGPISVASAGGWKNAVNSARTRLNKNMAPSTNRFLILSDDDEGQLGNIDLIQQVNTSGTTQTLREGEVGRLKGFNVFRATNVITAGSPASRKNLALHRDAIALVVRPISNATGSTPGAVQTIGTDPDAGLSIRLTISYNATLLSTQVTVDILYGVKTLDALLGVQLNSTST